MISVLRILTPATPFEFGLGEFTDPIQLTYAVPGSFELTYGVPAPLALLYAVPQTITLKYDPEGNAMP